MLSTQQDKSLTADGMIPGDRYWVDYCVKPEHNTEAAITFIDTFLKLELRNRQLFAVFVKVDPVDVRLITRIFPARIH